MLRLVLDTFWNEDFWLPLNTTWQDIAPGRDKSVVYADHRDLLYSLPLALMLILLRILLGKYVKLHLSSLKCVQLIFLETDRTKYNIFNNTMEGPMIIIMIRPK